MDPLLHKHKFAKNEFILNLQNPVLVKINIGKKLFLMFNWVRLDWIGFGMDWIGLGWIA